MATLTITPNPCLPSSTVNVHGAGFSPSQKLRISSGATSVQVKIAADGTFNVPLTVPATPGNYTISALKGSVIVASGSFSVTSPPPPPPPPAVVPTVPLSLSGVAGDGTVTLSWATPTSNGGAALLGYKIYRGGVFYTSVGVVTTYTNVGLSNGSPYTYAVLAYNSVGDGPLTASQTFTPVAVPPPPPVLPVISNIVESNLTGTGITVAWHVSVPAQGWIQYGPTTAYGTDTTHETSFNYQDHTQSITGLANGTLYHYKIHAVDSSGNIGLSADRTFTTTGAAMAVPSAPLNLTATAGDKQVTLAWTAPASNGGAAITNYKIYRNGSLLTTLGVVLNYTNTSLLNGSTYTYTVSAVNSVGEGIQSSSASATPAGVSPPTGAMYGNPIRMDGLGNTQVGGTNGSPNRLVAQRFRAEGTSLTSVRITFPNFNPGYCGGTGGSLRVTVNTDDGTSNHFPTTTVLATANISNLTGTQNNPPGGNLHPLITFGTPASLTVGQLYHIVFTNTDASPSVNFVSIDMCYQTSIESPRHPKYPDTDWACLFKDSSWHERGTGGDTDTYTSFLGLHYGSGLISGIGYAYRGSAGNITGTTAARMTFTVSGGDRTANSVSVRLKKVSGASPLTFSLKTGAGAVIESGTVAASLIPLTDRWITYNFASTRTLTNGASYNLELSCPSDTTYSIMSLYDGTNYGMDSACYFADGRAQSGSSGVWSNWAGRTDQDFMFYFRS